MTKLKLDLLAYVEESPDPPPLYILRAPDGRQLGQYETPEEAEAALVDLNWTEVPNGD